jgi:hypothetical protein
MWVRSKHRNDRSAALTSARGNSAADKTPLSNERFQTLLSKAGAFFAEAERDVEAERAAAIEEILQTLAFHGLTVDDLR